MNGPGSRQEIATYKSVGTRLASEGFHVWDGGGFYNLQPKMARAKWIKVVLTFQSS